MSLPTFTMRQLLEAGVHFGHRASRWNPKMRPYIHGRKNLIHIIDVRETIRGLLRGKKYLKQVASTGSLILFVGTKRQGAEAVAREAARCGMPYVSDRWLGGTLTNFQTVTRSIAKFKKYQQMETSGEMDKLPSKEVAAIKREMTRMTRNFNGIVEMGSLPAAMFVVDTNHEKIAVAEHYLTEGYRCPAAERLLEQARSAVSRGETFRASSFAKQAIELFEQVVKDLAEELPEEVKGQVEIIPVRWIDEVLDRALETKPVGPSDEAPATPPPAANPAATAPVVKH